jgi:hypothetical protein
MENQGKRKDQIKFSEDIISWSLIGIIILLVIVGFYNFLKS